MIVQVYCPKDGYHNIKTSKRDKQHRCPLCGRPALTMKRIPDERPK